MTSPITIRTEAPADADAITAVTLATFATVEVSDQTEHLVVHGLREAGALTLSLGARGCCLVGHPRPPQRMSVTGRVTPPAPVRSRSR